MARLQSAVRGLENGAALTHALVGERASGIAFFQLPLPEQQKLVVQLEGGSKDFKAAAYRKSPSFAADFAYFLDRMEEAATATALPYPRSLDEAAPWMTRAGEVRGKGYAISALLLPTLGKPMNITAEFVARLRVAGAALAVERYRVVHQNAEPDSLDPLVPGFLEKAPQDPFDGQRLRYTKLPPRGFRVYSLGKDRKDDHGKSRPPGSPAEAGYDLSFVVKR